ncbi:MAG: hypothetical protein H6638_04380 [Ardenticatenales bacterium]|nr:hypothetical protein [Ardenticatenales bacterium]
MVEADVETSIQSVFCGFSALEDEPWIEAPKAEAMEIDAERVSSALEDEPWIEAGMVCHGLLILHMFQCS